MIVSNPILGTGLHAIGGASAASCYLPNTQTRKWSWGTFWLAQALFAWIIMPIMEWFYNGLGGIRQEETSAGYKNIVIYPEVVGDLTFAKTSYQCPYGEIKTNWEKKEGLFTLAVEIPVNTQATVYLPFSGEVAVSNANGRDKVKFNYIGMKDGRMAYHISSGKYVFNVKLTGK